MDATLVTPRNFLFIGLVAVVVFVFVFLAPRMQKRETKRIKAIVYSDPHDTVLQDLQKGISEACRSKGIFLDYVEISDDLENLDTLVADHVLHDAHSDAFIVRVPGRRTVEALRRRGRDHVTVLSTQVTGEELETLGYIDSPEVPKDTAVLVHASMRIALSGHVSATLEDVLDQAMDAKKNGIETLIVASPQFSRNQDIMDILRSMGFKNLTVMEPRGALLGSRAVDALERSFS
jgi:hypothetical protein